MSEHLSPRGALGRLEMKAMIANWTREIRPSRMKRGACGTVSIMGDGLRSIGKPMERPPYPGMLRAPHFYPNIQKNRLAKLAMAMPITMPAMHCVWVFSVRSSSTLRRNARG